MARRVALVLLVTLAIVILTPFWGTVAIPLKSIQIPGSEFHFIFWQLRLPRALLGFLAGAILALAGFLSQNIFKNSLATPDILGITTGAAAATMLAIKAGWSIQWLWGGGGWLFGFIGAVAAMAILLAIARILKSFSVYTLLMTGVAINLFCASFIALVQYFFDFSNMVSAMRWLMGGISQVGYGEVFLLLILAAAILLVVLVFKREIILVSAGDDFALGKGMNVRRFNRTMVMVLAVAVGGVVSVTGPIGFIALIVPHISRLLSRNSYQATVWLLVLIGGGILVFSDFLARTLLAPIEIPVGIVTSLLGAPFFLVILLGNLRDR